MRDIDNEIRVKNVRRWDDPDDDADIVSDIMDDDMVSAIREGACKAANMDKDQAADISDDTDEDDIDTDEFRDDIDVGV